ncbi:hypothetical protein [Paenibacillus polymyxa]|uniref:hypothetical protein n=1 Tax=Paenibacillus polymyxa TaxID=1406 RepID=UPI002ED0F119|nr:hypothetical protein [Paenibacillus polymyxa]
MSVKDMTDQQLNRELAELMGYIVTEGEHDLWPEWYELKKNGVVQSGDLYKDWAWDNAPDYCSDTAASLEVQTAAIKANDRQYAINLAKRLEWDGDDLEYSDNDVFSYTGVTVFMLASPRERAEAAYMTLSSQNQVNTED